MSWKCPQCGQTNENALHKCTCGYAYYEVLGTKEDTPEKSVKQTYEYLLRVWKTPAEGQNTSARDKLGERVKKINDAYAVFRQISKGRDSGIKNAPLMKIAMAAGAAFIVVIAVFLLLSSNRKSAQPTGVPVAPPPQTAIPEIDRSAPPAQPATVQPSDQQSLPKKKSDTPDMSADKTPDWAIESVKKSNVLHGSATVDTLVGKWTAENADKLKMIGWLAKKFGDQTYLVTYTATDGSMTTGFYFEINIETGEIRNISGNTELQQKYGIK